MAERTLKNFINGDYVDATADSAFDVIDPATGQGYAQSPVSDDPSPPLTDPNLGTVPMCCDVGMLRDEDGTPFRCDFDG